MGEEQLNLLALKEEIFSIKELMGTYLNQNAYFNLSKTIEYLGHIGNELSSSINHEPSKEELELISLKVKNNFNDYLGISINLESDEPEESNDSDSKK